MQNENGIAYEDTVKFTNFFIAKFKKVTNILCTVPQIATRVHTLPQLIVVVCIAVCVCVCQQTWWFVCVLW